MDQGPEIKKARLSTGSPWPSSGTAVSHHRASLPNPNPATAPPQAPHHPTPPVPYQASHPSSFPSDHPPVSSPAPPTPVSAHSYTHSHTLPPPPPPPPHPSSAASHQLRYAHHFDDRRHHEPEAYAPGQEYRQDYRPDPRPDYRPDYRQDPRPEYRQDYRQPASPAHVSPYTTPYGRDKPLNDDGPPQIRRSESVSAAQGQAPPTPTQHQMDDGRRQMSFDNLAHPAQGPGPMPHPQAHGQPPLHQHPNQHQSQSPIPNQHQQTHPPPPPPPPPGHVQIQQQQQQQQQQPPPTPHPHAHMHTSAPPQLQTQHPPPHPQGPQAAANIYRTPSYPPTPTAASQPQHFEAPAYSHATPAPQTADVLYPISYATAGKKKAQRASQACDSCRSLKAKCDETKPCKNCREKNIECKYRDPIPKQQDKVTADILENIIMLKDEIRAERDDVRAERDDSRAERHEMRGALRGFQQYINRRMNSLEKALKQVAPNAELKSEPSPGPDDFFGRDEYLSPGDADITKDDMPPKGPADAPVQEERALPPDEAQRITRQMQSDFSMEVVPGPSVPPGEPAMPAVHTTLAGLLLTWPTIHERVHKLLENEGINYLWEYPIRQEEQRGNIRFYGRGEGFDQKMKISGSDDPNPTGSMMERGPSSRSSSQSIDDMGEGSDASQPSGEIWGQVGGLNPPSPVDFIKGTPLRPNGDLDLSPDKVWKYVKSYEENIQNMHPLIIPKELYAMVTLFLETLPKSSSSSSSSMQASRSWGPAPVATFAGPPEAQTTSPEPGSLKRKRSPAAEGSTPIAPTQPLKPGQPFRNAESALVLVILALGKICLFKNGRLPDVVPEHDGEAGSSQSPQAHNGYSPGSIQDSPASASASLQQSAGGGSDRGMPNPPSRRASMQSGQQVHQATPLKGVTMKRNLDNIPGLEYFAVACDILGGHIGGRELKHVWAYILGCLYYGQLGRPIQSLEFVAIAGRHLQAILRPHLHRYGQIKNDKKSLFLKHKRDNQYIFAFWTCLQLESDILAELQLPPSGILAYEHQMPYPSGDVSLKQGFDEFVLQSYTAQLYLRNQLNEIHKNLYDGRHDQQKINTGQIEVFADVLQPDMWAPSRFRFRDEDPPAKDILSARLRAKYWGAQMVVHRFFIRRILELNYNKRIAAEKAQAQAGSDAEFKPPPPSQELQLEEEEAFSPKSIQLARRGIQALVESTRAFHGLPEKRFIITNVFGTAHAQWGNLLVLDSVQRDPTLGQFIDEEYLNSLFRKTIAFFEVVSQPTSSLGYDLRILKGLYQIRRDSPLSQRPQVPSHGLPLQSTPYPIVSSSAAPSPPFPPGDGSGAHSIQPPPPPPPPPVHQGSPMQMSPIGMSPATQNMSPPPHQHLTPPIYGGASLPPTSAVSPTSAPMAAGTAPGHTIHPPPPPLPPQHQQYASPLPSTHSPVVQGRLPPMQYGPPPPVKTPSTPTDIDFPHHLPPFDQQRPL